MSVLNLLGVDSFNLWKVERSHIWKNTKQLRIF